MGGERRRAAVIGHPIAHSRSPQMHNAAYAALGLDWRYEAVDVAPHELEAFVRGLEGAGYAGVNVTIPHKQAVLELCDLVAPEATAAGSVNTIVVQDGGRLIGHSTDGRGLLWALGGISPTRALVLGSGGAARAAVHALKAAGWEVLVSARQRQAADELGAELLMWPPPQAAPLVVNATPIGQAWDPAQMPIAPWLIEPGWTVCDLAYQGDGRPTALASAAAARGARVVDGLEVLVGQGIYAFQLLTGVTAPVEVMRSAARA
ncbi:MAG: shikimate dehydrogenase [Gaiellales bacterium]